MIQVNEAYRNACKSPTRQSYIKVKYGLYDKQAKTKIANVICESKSFSNVAQTYDEKKTSNINYISCEPNRIKLNDTFCFVQDKNTINTNQNIGYWSNIMSNENCLFSSNDNPTITYNFNSNINFTDLTLHFQEIIVDMNVKYYLNNVLVFTRQIRNNDTPKFETSDIVVYENSTYFDKLELEFIKTKEPYRYVKFNEIDFGVYKMFNNDEIDSLDIIDEMSIDSSELSSNSLTLNIKDIDNKYDVLNPNNQLKYLQDRQEMTVFHYLKVGNEYKEIPLGSYLLKKMQVNSNVLSLECYDDTYFMNDIYYGSKFYDNVECVEIFKDIFNYFNYDINKYFLDNELIGIKLSGYIPQVEMREALRIVAEASGCVINKTRYGIAYVFRTYDNCVKVFGLDEYSGLVPQRNLYNNVIDIVQYNYDTISENNEILYSAIITKIGEYTIDFNKYPIAYSLYIDNPNSIKNNNNDYNIIELNATCCKIKVNSENQLVELNGKYYIQSKTTKRLVKDKTIDTSDYAINKIDNTLITKTNANEIGNWKLNASDISYNFTINSTPYIECGDTCKIQTKYKDGNGKYIFKHFVPTRLEFTNGIKQEMSGE